LDIFTGLVEMTLGGGDQMWRIFGKELGRKAGNGDEEILLKGLSESGMGWEKLGSMREGNKL
jgi:hypothetical protein